MSQLIGYARTSTVDQIAGLEQQIRDLRAAGCDKIYHEKLSSVGERPELDRAMEYAREGDTLIVTKVDRLARSNVNLCQIESRLALAGIGLRVLAIGMDTSTPMGRFAMTMFGAAAELERSMMLERQIVGIAKAKADGKYKGRKVSAKRDDVAIRELFEGGKTKTEIAAALNIGRATVYRALGC